MSAYETKVSLSFFAEKKNFKQACALKNIPLQLFLLLKTVKFCIFFIFFETQDSDAN